MTYQSKVTGLSGSYQVMFSNKCATNVFSINQCSTTWIVQ